MGREDHPWLLAPAPIGPPGSIHSSTAPFKDTACMLHLLMTGQVRVNRMKPSGERHGQCLTARSSGPLNYFAVGYPRPFATRRPVRVIISCQEEVRL